MRRVGRHSGLQERPVKSSLRLIDLDTFLCYTCPYKDVYQLWRTDLSGLSNGGLFMPIVSDDILYSVVREEHMIHNDFFLRYLDFVDEPHPTQLIFTCFAGGKACYEIRYGAEEIAQRFRYGKEETARYRQSSLSRILGCSHNLQFPFLHEYFSFFSSEIVNRLTVKAKCGERNIEREIAITPYESLNRHTFPLRGTFLVTDTYPSINSHRWCRNSEFAFDVGLFEESLEHSVICGAPVFASCDGIVEEAFDGLADTDDTTDLEQIEKQYGEHARIDGNHVLIRHANREYSLYAHLSKNSILVKAGERVCAGQQIGCVGSSGSSYLPHLHFHVMLDGIEGPGVPVHFDGLKTLLGETCMLEDTVNLVRNEK